MSGRVTVLAGQTFADINVGVLDDRPVEATETVVVTLSSVTSGDADIPIENSAKTATVNISDTDTALVSIAKVNDGSEPGSAGKFRVTLSNPSSTDTVVSYSVT